MKDLRSLFKKNVYIEVKPSNKEGEIKRRPHIEEI